MLKWIFDRTVAWIGLCFLWSVLLGGMMLCMISCHNATETGFADEEHVYYVQSDDTTLFVHPFVHEGRQYIVLPSYWDTTKLFVAESKDSASKEMQGLKNLRPYDEKKITEVKLMKSKLPTIYIRTESGSIEFVNANKKNEEGGYIIVVDTMGNVEYDGELEAIHGRGNYTWSREKKPYSIKLSNKTSFLGLKKAKKFNLLSQPYDPTGLRNWLALTTAQQMGLNDNMTFSFANVYLNGNYAGCYLVTNKVDRKIQQDFLLEIGPRPQVDPSEVQATFQLTDYISLTIKKPKHPTPEQMAYIEGEWLKMKETLIKDATENSEQTIDSLLDIPSFVRNYLCQEVFMNMDAGIASFFIGKDSLGKFFADPLWDMELSMNCPGCNRPGNDLCRVMYARADFSPDSTGYTGIWGMLYKNDTFRHQVSSYYFSRMRSIVKELFWGESWTSICSYLQTDMEIDNLRWRNGAVFEAQCNEMRDWMDEKLHFLDWVWNEKDENLKCVVTLYVRDTSRPLQYVIPRNTTFSEPLPFFNSIEVTDLGHEDTFVGYEVAGSPISFDTLVVQKDITVMGRWKKIKQEEPGIYDRLKVWLWYKLKKT